MPDISALEWHISHAPEQRTVNAWTPCRAGCGEDVVIALPEELAARWIRNRAEPPDGVSEETAELLRSGTHPECRAVTILRSVLNIHG